MKYPSTLSSMMMLAAGLLALSGVSLAQDSMLRSESPHFIEDGWDVRLGAGLITSSGELYRGMKEENGLTILLDASYTNGDFYAIANEEEGLLLGYSLVRDDNWVVDAVFGPKFEMDFNDGDMFDGQLSHLDKRDVDGQLGARFTWYGDTNRLSISLTGDVTGVHDGFLGTVDYQQEWQARNWLLTGRAGLALFSDKMANHMVGVSAHEATASMPRFEAKASQAVYLELMAEYPVNENWIFETKAAIAQFGSELADSPITRDDTYSVVTTGFKYQF